MHHASNAASPRRLLTVLALALVAAACSSAGSASPTTGATAPRASLPASSGAPSSTPGPGVSGAPEASGGTTSGDIPDNAIFLTYHGTNPAFSIQYVEGWQVTPQPDGVVIRDKDSSETVAIVGAQSDVAGYVSATDLPALQALAGFKLVKQDTVKVGNATYVHLLYHLPAPPDPVTGKQVASTVDRYYVPGPAGLAIVSLSTPDGVDNVDAFKAMIASFKWS
jgi:hypothetical protein